MDILFLSVSAGGGHLKAAEAIMESVEERYPGSRTLLVDTLKYINPIVDRLIVGSYLNAVKTTPKVYGKLYELSEYGENMNDFSKGVNRLLSHRIKTLIEQFKPSVIVCTHPFSLQIMSSLKRKNTVDLPVLAILTDFVTHSFWIHENIDAYVVAHECMKLEMINRGIPESSVYPLGIPVSSDFLQKHDRSEVLEQLGLDNRLTFLVMGGSLGFGEVKSTFQSLMKCRKDFQIITVCGRNSKLKRQLEKYSQSSPKRVKVLGFTNRIPELMDASNFIFTKPGGLTVAEALSKELPMFIMSPIPGQEEGNSFFLTNNGAAARIHGNKDMDSILCQILDNPLRIRHMKEMASYLSKPNAAEDIVNLIGKLELMRT